MLSFLTSVKTERRDPQSGLNFLLVMKRREHPERVETATQSGRDDRGQKALEAIIERRSAASERPKLSQMLYLLSGSLGPISFFDSNN